MKKKFVFLTFFSLLVFSSCGVSSKSIKRHMMMEDGVSNPVSIDELKFAISKYQAKATETQMQMSQVGMWYKILGTRYIDAKMYGEALKCFQTALEYYPNNQNLYYYIGVCAGYMSHTALDFEATGSSYLQKKMNYLHLAEEAYLRALEIDDRYTGCMYGIGVLYVFELDEPEKAIPYLEKLISIDTRHNDAMFVLARAYYSCYDFEKAVAVYDRIIGQTKSSEIKSEAENLKRLVLEASYGK